MTASPLMKTCRLFALLAATAVSANAEPILPLAEGTVWEYERTEQAATGVERSTHTVRIGGTESFGGEQLLKLETRKANELTKTELISVTNAGVLCFRRTTPGGKTVTFDPPQTIVKAPLQTGAKWTFDDRVEGADMHQEFTVLGEEEVTVPAGTFRAFRIRCEQPWPISMTVERWFVPGTGFVKDVTVTRGPGGRLLSRVALVLKSVSVTAPSAPSPPSEKPTPEISPAAADSPAPEPSPASSPEVMIEVAAEREGEPQTEFRSDAPQIFVRWSGRGLPSGSTVRISWVAEDVGDLAPPNFVVDETESVITMPELNARFTLSRPLDGWAAGKYRVELYIDDTLVQEVKVTLRD